MVGVIRQTDGAYKHISSALVGLNINLCETENKQQISNIILIAEAQGASKTTSSA